MTTWFVSRHPGAIDWAKLHGINVTQWVKHLDMSCISEGDIVIGSLPVNSAEIVCRKRARYFHVCLNLPESMRGRELTVEDMVNLGATIQEYRILICEPQSGHGNHLP